MPIKQKQVTVELNIPQSLVDGQPDSRGRKLQTMRIKLNFWKRVVKLPCWNDQLEVLGTQNQFPVVVVAGPVDLVDIFAAQVQHELPNLVRSVDSNLKFELPSF